MKEATGELNTAVIVAISIGVLAAFFFSYLWPIINDNFTRNSQCSKALCDCSDAKNNDYMCECWVGDSSQTFLCPFEG